MGYYCRFPDAIPHLGVRSIALLALSPLVPKHAFDLHVLTMPPAFNLSQDQTLHLNIGRKAPGDLSDSAKLIRFETPLSRGRSGSSVKTTSIARQKAMDGST